MSKNTNPVNYDREMCDRIFKNEPSYSEKDDKCDDIASGYANDRRNVVLSKTSTLGPETAARLTVIKSKKVKSAIPKHRYVFYLMNHLYSLEFYGNNGDEYHY